MNYATSARPASDDRAVFLFDDCCPMCRGYTATFSALGWTGRQAFSAAGAEMIDAIDLDRARHQIPLVDRSTGAVRYGLDGILGVVAAEVPPLAPVVANRSIRRGLDGLYWLITYNRRHIVAAPPPADGIDCGPDFNRASVGTYLALTVATATWSARAAGAVPAVAGAAVVAGGLVGGRHPGWGVNRLQAAGHVASVTAVAGLGAAAVRAAGGSPALASMAAVAVAGRKLWLRRWLRRPGPTG